MFSRSMECFSLAIFSCHIMTECFDYLRKVFIKINNYSSKTVQNINFNITNEPQTNTTDNNETKLELLLPFSVKQGIRLLSNKKIYITYKGTKLSTQFSVKLRTKFESRHNIVYFSRCPNGTCNETYVEKTDSRINERIIDHNKRDKISYLLKYASESQHTHIWKDDFKILNGNYNSSIKRKISEALYIRTLKPTLNVKEK